MIGHNLPYVDELDLVQFVSLRTGLDAATVAFVLQTELDYLVMHGIAVEFE